MNNKKFVIIIGTIGAYLISTGVSFLFFSKTQLAQKVSSPPPSVTKTATGGLFFDPTLPKTEECPLNGTKYSKQQKDWWEKHRPLGVMIENHQNSRPQSGLSFADVVYEAVAEGGITRFLAVYYCQDANPIGPVRSARTYFIDFLSEYADYPLYAHVGGANTPGPADALSQLSTYGWTGHNDLNQFSIGFPTFWRDYDRLGHTTETEHTMYSTTTKLWDFAKKDRKLTNEDEEGNSWDKKFVKYTFKDDAPSDAAAQTIHVEFWEKYKDYFVDWKYDKISNIYTRSNSGIHIDNNTIKRFTEKNIVILYMIESNANDGYENNAHLLYRTKGTGKAQVFMDGKEIKGTWRKDSRISRTLIFDQGGNAIKFNRGTIWFEILPTDGIATVK